jgi:hypothetical protein
MLLMLIKFRGSEQAQKEPQHAGFGALGLS